MHRDINMIDSLNSSGASREKQEIVSIDQLKNKIEGTKTLLEKKEATLQGKIDELKIVDGGGNSPAVGQLLLQLNSLRGVIVGVADFEEDVNNPKVAVDVQKADEYFKEIQKNAAFVTAKIEMNLKGLVTSVSSKKAESRDVYSFDARVEKNWDSIVVFMNLKGVTSNFPGAIREFQKLADIDKTRNIIALQQLININLPTNEAKLNADGKFGLKTERALKVAIDAHIDDANTDNAVGGTAAISGISEDDMAVVDEVSPQNEATVEQPAISLQELYIRKLSGKYFNYDNVRYNFERAGNMMDEIKIVNNNNQEIVGYVLIDQSDNGKMQYIVNNVNKSRVLH